jgi:hypothetical protein
MSKTNTASAEQIDLKDIVRRLDMASGLFAHAAQSFTDMCAIFEAIKATAPTGSLTARLAQLGINNCESHDSDFTEYGEDYGANVEAYSAALPIHPFRRLSSGQDSSQEGA